MFQSGTVHGFKVLYNFSFQIFSTIFGVITIRFCLAKVALALHTPRNVRKIGILISLKNTFLCSCFHRFSRDALLFCTINSLGKLVHTLFIGTLNICNVI